jgi:hypothetical protein
MHCQFHHIACYLLRGVDSLDLDRSGLYLSGQTRVSRGAGMIGCSYLQRFDRHPRTVRGQRGGTGQVSCP